LGPRSVLGTARSYHGRRSAPADPSFTNTSTTRWVGYTRAILAKGEKQSNRTWESYPPYMQAISERIADHLEAYVRV